MQARYLSKETELFTTWWETHHGSIFLHYNETGGIGEPTLARYVPRLAEKLILAADHKTVGRNVKGRHWLLYHGEEDTFPPSPVLIGYGSYSEYWDWSPDVSAYQLVQIEIGECFESTEETKYFTVIVLQVVRLDDVAHTFEQTETVSLPSHLFVELEELRSTEDGKWLVYWQQLPEGQDTEVAECFVIGTIEGQKRLILSGNYFQYGAPPGWTQIAIHNSPITLESLPGFTPPPEPPDFNAALNESEIELRNRLAAGCILFMIAYFFLLILLF